MSSGRRLALAGIVLVAVALLVVFALYNRGNLVVLEFGLARWRGEAVYAIYAAVFVGLLLMFLVGLPADLAERRQRERLERRVRELAKRTDEPRRETPREERPREGHAGASAEAVGGPGSD
ncbi:MAG: DUF1049 domain-containing protein [Gemmatimonadetes bacterium]|nr:DUF1049 domain-containing protein [Gemmatimonadota bacterium]